MKWKRALFGYRESEVNRYIQDVAEARDRESDAYHEKIRAAEVTKLQQEAAMETMRHDIGVRHARLEKVESGIVSMYYRFIQSQAERDPGQIQKSAETGGYSLSRGEGKRLSKKRALSTSFLGVAPKDLAEYLISREQDHKELISGLSDKLHKLEKAIETQSEEIRKLEGFLKQPEMQESFIDMAERFLARFEQMLQDTVRKTMYPGSGGNGGGG
ncbi:MAG: hypothetical protein LBH09_01065, partial [Peptococcaceae bacterium]|nr:hypothetical protein [Peptococcaceae bacterium]